MNEGRYYIQARLSEHIDQVHGGYLLCRDVPIARVGQLLYRPQELLGDNGRPKIQPKPGENVIVAVRTAADLFDPRTIASFEGKPVTLRHDQGWVTPDNHQEVAVGIVQNVRAGEGDDSDKLLADLLITDREAIQAVLEGILREISCGYEAEYDQLEPGLARQWDIVGNHVSILEAGRCGSECAIFDAAMQPNPEENDVSKLNLAQRIAARIATLTGQSQADAIQVVDQAMADLAADAAPTKTADKAALKAAADDLQAQLAALTTKTNDAAKALADAEAAEAAAAAAKTTDADPPAPPAAAPAVPPAAPAAPAQGQDPTLAAVTALSADVKTLIAAVAKLLKIESGDEPAEAPAADAPADPAAPTPPKTQDGLPAWDAETLARAEILCPGVGRTSDMKAVALQRAYATAEGKAAIDQLLGGKTLDSADQDILFVGAAAIVSAARTQALGEASAAAARTLDAGGKGSQAMTPERLTELNRAHYGTTN